MTEIEMIAEVKSSKRKRQVELTELEVDLNAAEPPSKKALRMAKRKKMTGNEGIAEQKTSVAHETTVSQSDSKDNAKLSKPRSDYGIWIGNLSFTTTKEDLLTFITSDVDHPIEENEVTRIHLPNGPVKMGRPQNKGFAYIDFINVAALNHGLELSEKLLAGRRVLIKNAKSFEGRPASKEEVASGKPPSKRIFVGNLSFDTTAEVLETHFAVCGPIIKTQVATFEDSGKCKGYAWVEFEQLSSAQAAMRGWVEEGTDTSMKQSKRRIWLKKIEGRPLRMEFAEDATTRYNKRYGKDAKKPGSGIGEDSTAEGVQSDPIVEVKEDTRPTAPQRVWQNRDETHRPKHRNGYEEATVKRMTGAITKSQGTKVVFD